MKMNVLCRGLLLTALLAPTAARAAGDWYLPEGTIACLTQESFKVQRQLVMKSQRELADDCGTTKQRFKVELLKYSFFSYSHVRVVENGVELWVFSSNLDK